PYTRVKFSYKEDPTALFRLPPFELSPEEMEAGAQVEASAKASAEKKMSPGGKSSTTPTSAKSSSALSGKGDKAGSLAEKEASAHGPKDNAALKEGTDAVKILK
ncbi:MAG TPA: hypothetical protein VHF22_07405, partial [Planctomycetota bacterium]|nr:hypothetical protein [Planctomycetota bacterium]